MYVFGTLRNQSTREMLDVYPTEIQEATLEGFRKEGLNIIEDENSSVPGDYFMVTQDELERLDRYEGLDRNFYHRFLVNVMVDGKEKRVYAYQIIGT